MTRTSTNILSIDRVPDLHEGHQLVSLAYAAGAYVVIRRFPRTTDIILAATPHPSKDPGSRIFNGRPDEELNDRAKRERSEAATGG